VLGGDALYLLLVNMPVVQCIVYLYTIKLYAIKLYTIKLYAIEIQAINAVDVDNRVSRVAGMCQESKGGNAIAGQVQFDKVYCHAVKLPPRNYKYLIIEVRLDDFFHPVTVGFGVMLCNSDAV